MKRTTILLLGGLALLLGGCTGLVGGSGAACSGGTVEDAFLSGVGAPAATLGEDGDVYLDTATNTVYVKEDGAWSDKGSYVPNASTPSEPGLYVIDYPEEPLYRNQLIRIEFKRVGIEGDIVCADGQYVEIDRQGDVYYYYPLDYNNTAGTGRFVCDGHYVEVPINYRLDMAPTPYNFFRAARLDLTTRDDPKPIPLSVDPTSVHLAEVFIDENVPFEILEDFTVKPLKAGEGSIAAYVDEGYFSSLYVKVSDQDGEVRIWVPSESADFVSGMSERFKEAYPEYDNWSFSVEMVGDTFEIMDRMRADPYTAADIGLVADACIEGGVEFLDPVPAEERDAIVETDVDQAVDAFSVGGELYAYPNRLESTFMLFYDTRYVSEEQAGSIEGILDACRAAGVNFRWSLTNNGWYGAAPFLGHGLTLQRGVDNEGRDIQRSDFYSTKGIQIAERVDEIYREYSDLWMIYSDDFHVGVEFGNGELGAAILWNNYYAISEVNPHVAVAELPTLTVGTTAVQLTPFVSYGGAIVNRYAEERLGGSKRLEAAHAFARYLGSEEAQRAAYEEIGYSPTNEALLQDIDFSDSPFMEAAADQYPNYAVQRTSVTSEYWNGMANFWYGMQDEWQNTGGIAPALEQLVNTPGWEATELLDNGTIA